MKKILSLAMVFIVVLSTFLMFAPQAKAETTLIAWKDDTSLGLENDHLLLHGSAVAGNYLWFFDYLIFKDTGTMWYQPWDELAIIVYEMGSLGPWVTDPVYEINAFTEADKAYLTYSIESGNLRQDVTYTLYPSEPYIHITFSITNIGSTTESTWAGVQFTTWIAGDYANDYYYVPGYGERQFTGTTDDTYYPDATEMWVAMWDQNKGEGAGMLGTKGFVPSNIMSIDWGGLTGEGFRFTSDNFNLAPGQSSATYDCYLYFFTGTGRQETKDFYDSLAPAKTLLGTGWGWMRIDCSESVCGRARLYKIGDEQIELTITSEGETYSRKWNIISHKEYKYGERYLCYSDEWGFLMVGFHRHRRLQFWYAVGRGVVALGFPSLGKLGRLRLIPI